MCGNAASVVSRDGMSRAPVVRFARAYHAHEAKLWLEEEDNYRLIMDAFNSTSRSATTLCVCQLTLVVTAFYEVTLHRARLLLRWVTIHWYTIVVFNQPPMLTQPAHPFFGLAL